MDDRNLNKVYWSCHDRGHTSFKLLVDYHSTVNGWAGSTQGFNLHIYNLLCSQNCLFRVPLQQLHSRENIFKEPSAPFSVFFSGSGPEEGGSHSSGEVLIKSTKSFWCSHSHQPVWFKEKWALLTLKIKEEGNFLASVWFLVFLLRIPHHLRLCEDGKHPPLVWWEDSMLMLNWEEGRHLRNLLGKLSVALWLEGLFYFKQVVCHVLQKRGHGMCPSLDHP